MSITLAILCLFLICPDVAFGTLSPNVRRFKIQKDRRRVTDVPIESVQEDTNNYHSVIRCAARCYSKHWCTGFNADHARKMCHLFDFESATSMLVLDATYSYGTWTKASVVETSNKNCSDTVSLLWGRHCFKVVPRSNDSSSSFDAAVAACSRIGGILAPMISSLLRQYAYDNLPLGKSAYVGLRQREMQPTHAVGWEWINTANQSQEVVDIDSSNTLPIVWADGEPNDFEGANEKYAVMWDAQDGKINDASDDSYGIRNSVDFNQAFCQSDVSDYRFQATLLAHRISTPQEKNLSLNLADCAVACLESAFCRAFSHKSTTDECHHHSVPPNATEAAVVADAEFIIYA